MPSTTALLNRVLDRIRPSKSERAEVKSRLMRLLKKMNLKDAKAVLGGSGAKDTWLSGTYDVDLFVCFDYKKFSGRSNELSNILHEFLRKRFKAARLHGSRDYFQINQGRFTFEIIPILGIRTAKEAKNITDVSILHSAWVKKRIEKNKSLADETRLMKAFCRAQNVYGAESYIQGFSGYVCEILVIYYGSFLNVLRNAVKWKNGRLIDLEGHFRKKDVFKELNMSKLQSPLIVIDPVQPDRNAAAALGNEKFELFKAAAKRFLGKPEEAYFEKTEPDVPAIKKNALKKGKKVLLLEIRPLKGKKDIIGAKLMKAFNYIKGSLEENDFRVSGSSWLFEKNALFCFFLSKKPLPESIVIKGPRLSLEKHASSFRKAHRSTFTKRGRLYARESRKFKTPEALINCLRKETYLKERINDMRIID